MKILVTGGAGFIGSNFIRLLLGEGNRGRYPVVNLDKLTYAGNLENLASLRDDPRHIFVRGDIGDAELVGRLLQQHRPRAVVNFAAESHVDRSIHGPEDFIQTNIVGTFHLLEAVRAYWSGLADEEKTGFRFLHVSTDEVYGSLAKDDPAFSETHRYEPNSPYSASKAASDHLVRAYHHTYGLPALTTNCSNNYGPYHFPEKLIPLAILNLLEGRPVPVYGDGRNVRDWLFVDDHARAIWRILRDGTAGRTYAVGGGNEWENLRLVNELCEKVAVQTGRPKDALKGLITFVKDRPGHDRRYAIDAGRIRDELGWRSETDFSSGLDLTVRWYREHPEWVRRIRTGEYRAWVEKHYGAAP